jgi:hypothetical protein
MEATMGRIFRWLIGALVVFLFTSFLLAQEKPAAPPAEVAIRVGPLIDHKNDKQPPAPCVRVVRNEVALAPAKQAN